jgi:hypothetical protein
MNTQRELKYSVKTYAYDRMLVAEASRLSTSLSEKEVDIPVEGVLEAVNQCGEFLAVTVAPIQHRWAIATEGHDEGQSAVTDARRCSWLTWEEGGFKSGLRRKRTCRFWLELLYRRE